MILSSLSPNNRKFPARVSKSSDFAFVIHTTDINLLSIALDLPWLPNRLLKNSHFVHMN